MMIIRNKKKLIILVLLGVLIILGMLIGGCLQAQLCTVYPETQKQIIQNITTEEAYLLIQKNISNKNFVILDVRTPEEFASENIENAINIDYYSATFKNDLDQLDKNSTYLIYCRSGNRSGNALNVMKDLDFREVYNMLGGIVKWKAEKFPVVE
jgi:rhodanese-related sulfurtransferase